MSPYDTREAEKRFVLSCTLSNTTMVSYRENPKMVRNATTVAGVTESPVTEYTPTLINTSCAIAAMAETAIFHSKRHAMYSDTTRKNTSNARAAFSVMLRPHDELTSATLTSSAFTPAFSASAF